MARIQDIQALEHRIYDAVEEYISNPSGYNSARIHIWCDDEMNYQAECVDECEVNEDNGIYDITDFIDNGDIDYDRVDEVANEWIFIE